MQHTTNYNLNQWEATDRVTREDFNADNAKIDAALAGCATHAAGGQYAGSGRGASVDVVQTIHLGFRPTAVLIVGGNGLDFSTTGAIVLTENYIVDGHTIVEIVSDGFAIHFVAKSDGSVYAPRLNNYGTDYKYIAVG